MSAAAKNVDSVSPPAQMALLPEICFDQELPFSRLGPNAQSNGAALAISPYC